MASRSLTVKILGDASSLQREFAKADRSVTGLGKRMGRLGTLGKLGVAGGAVAGLAAVGKGLQSSVKAAEQAELAQARLRQALKASNVSYKTHGKAIDKAIQKTSKLAGLDDEELSDSFAKLVRTTGSVKRAMKDMGLAADIARGRNISLEQATKIVEKAETGQLRGLKAIGVHIGKGTTATQALERAQKKFAGSAVSYGKTAAGAQAKLSVAFENLKEKIGAKLIPVITKLALKLVNFVDWAEKNWPRFKKAIQPVIDAIRNLGPTFQVMLNIVKPIVSFYFGKVFPLQMKVMGTAIKAVGVVAVAFGKTFKTVVNGVLWLIDKFLAGMQKLAEGASHLPFVGDQFKGVAKKIGEARKSVQALNRQLDALDGKTVSVNVITRAISQIEEQRSGLPLRARPGAAAPAPRSRTVPRRNLSVRDREPTIVVHSHTYLDGRPIAHTVTKEQQRSARRTGTQTTGPHAGNATGLTR